MPEAEVSLTMPDPSDCNRPLPDPNGPDDKHVDVRRERIDCMLLDNKNGTLDDVLGMEPPWKLAERTRERVGDRKEGKMW